MSRSVTMPTGLPLFVTIAAAIPFFCIDLAASTTVLASGRYKTSLDMYFVTGSSRACFRSINIGCPSTRFRKKVFWFHSLTQALKPPKFRTLADEDGGTRFRAHGLGNRVGPRPLGGR